MELMQEQDHVVEVVEEQVIYKVILFLSQMEQLQPLRLVEQV